MYIHTHIKHTNNNDNDNNDNDHHSNCVYIYIYIYVYTYSTVSDERAGSRPAGRGPPSPAGGPPARRPFTPPWARAHQAFPPPSAAASCPGPPASPPASGTWHGTSAGRGRACPSTRQLPRRRATGRSSRRPAPGTPYIIL